MHLIDRVVAFEKLGKILKNLESAPNFNNIVAKTQLQNAWFERNNILYSAGALSQMLISSQLKLFLNSYALATKFKKIGVIIPSNIPFVGFYDFLCVLLSGNIFVGQLSSSNNILLPYLASLLIDLNSDFENFIFFEKKINNVDMIIATGTDRSAVKFNYTYSYLPKIIRKNRNSIAVLSGSETSRELEDLAFDVYMYFGLGCRSVSKLFLPDSFNIEVLRNIFSRIDLIHENQNYIQNYNYQKSLLVINSKDFIDFDNILLVNSTKFNSPISIIYYEYYDSIDKLNKLIELHGHQIQCIVSEHISVHNAIPFGCAQKPKLSDFPDQLDIIKFINSN